MRVAILALGSRGDIQPYLALGVGLVRAGHEVRLVSNVDHTALVKSYNLEMWTLDLDVKAALQSKTTSASIESGSHIWSFLEFAKIAKRGARLQVEVGLAATEGVDVLVTGFTGVFVGEGIAAKRKIPMVQAFNVPLSTTSSHAGALAPGLSWGPRSRRFSHVLTRQAIWMMGRATANAVRTEMLGTPSAPFFVSSKFPGLVPGPVIYGYSEAVLPAPTEWGKQAELTGYWFADEPTGWTPPPELEVFLAKGPKPVCIGFGSMSQRDPAATTRLVLEAVKRSGQRAILLAGWGGLTADELPDTIFQIDSIPHAWLYSRCAAVVHHGGAGTTAAGLRAGVPSIVVPFHGDQFFWAKRVQEMGVGPAPVPRTRLTAERLAKAIQAAVGDKKIAEAAAALGTRIRSEDGVTRAVLAIEQIAKSQG